MGACPFTDIVRGIRDADAAYRSACEEALHERGSDPYNGTISTTNGYFQSKTEPMTEGEANELIRAIERVRYDDPSTTPPHLDKVAQELGAKISKWGPCVAIPLCNTLKTESRTKKVALNHIEYAAYTQHGNHSVVLEQLKPLSGFRITGFHAAEADLKTKVKTRATDGERETRYFIDGERVIWDNGFPSQAAARAHVDASLARPTAQRWPGWPALHGANATLGVYAITRRADGSPLVESQRIVTRAELSVEYQMEQIPKPDQRKITGWMFYGIAAE